MRVSDNMTYGQVNRNMSDTRSKLSELQNQAASQKKINKPSDDPIGMPKVLAARTEHTNTEQFLRNINSAKTFLEYTDQSLGDLSESLMRVKELAIGQASGGSATAQTRMMVAAEVEQLYEQSVQIANRKLGERFIFGGFHTTEKPFGNRGEYLGDQGQVMIEVTKGSFIPMNVPGNHVFLGDPPNLRSSDSFSDLVPRTSEELVDARYNDYSKVPQRNSEDDRRQPMVKPQTSGPQSPEVQMRGPASDLAREEQRSTGENIFQVFKDLEVSLKSNDAVGVQESLNRIDSALEQVILARSQVGSRVQALETAQDSLQKLKVDTRAQASQIEDADVFEVYSDLNKNEQALKATLMSAGKLTSMSLMDFLR
ncbi:MAG: flagellar hook-associated protein FlgL [Bdellovibrionales bacterium]|nr:flagellar hook-associated protein FlgL [Bdellovibrionales bacterium]